MNNGVLKVVCVKDVKILVVLVVSVVVLGEGDEVVIWVVFLINVVVCDFVLLFCQLNDNVGVGSVVYYEFFNVLLMIGCVVVIKCLLIIVECVDNVGDCSVVIVFFFWVFVVEVVKLVIEFNKDISKLVLLGLMVVNVVVDECINVVLVSGELNLCQCIIVMIKQFDCQQVVQGNIKVIYLKYVKVVDLVEVLIGISSLLQSDK